MIISIDNCGLCFQYTRIPRVSSPYLPVNATFLSQSFFFALPGIPACTSNIPSCTSAHSEAITPLSLQPFSAGNAACVWCRGVGVGVTCVCVFVSVYRIQTFACALMTSSSTQSQASGHIFNNVCACVCVCLRLVNENCRYRAQSCFALQGSWG